MILLCLIWLLKLAAAAGTVPPGFCLIISCGLMLVLCLILSEIKIKE